MEAASPTARAVAELVDEIAPTLSERPEAWSELVVAVSQQTELSPLLVAQQLIAGGRLLALPPPAGIEATLTMLAQVTGSPSLSVWARSGDATLRCLGQAGVLSPRVAEDVARPWLTGEAAVSRPGWSGWSLPGEAAVLLAAAPPGPGEELALLAPTAVPLLAALWARETADERDATREATLGALQRRLARLRFDLHDGPQQDIVLLAQDLRLFREQLAPLLGGHPEGDVERAMGRLDDLEAQLLGLDGDLRRLSTAVRSPFQASAGLREALDEVVGAFAQRTGLRPETRVAGDVAVLTESQQIAVLALVREALSNVRKHSEADAVSITLAADPGGVSVEVRDNGTGFDVTTVPARAAAGGHLGLLGMRERVRMLGGRTEIDSRPGGPTVISAFLPPMAG